MRNPRISINDSVWSQVRGTAAAGNVTVSTVVETALQHYLEGRNTSMTSGSATPNFTGAVSEGDLVSGRVEVPLHGVQEKKDRTR